jgi:hypothetical protein
MQFADALRRCVVGRFAIVRECSSRSLEKVGRFRIEEEMVVIYLDGIGLFQVGRAQVIPVLLRLGEEVIRNRDGGAVRMMSLSGSGRGVKMVIKERLYIVPVRRVKRVLEGNEKKRAVFVVK